MYTYIHIYIYIYISVIIIINHMFEMKLSFNCTLHVTDRNIIIDMNIIIEFKLNELS